MARNTWFMALLLAAGAAGAAAPGIYLAPNASPLEAQAAAELQRYLFAASRELTPVIAANAVPADASGYVLGTANHLPHTGLEWPFGLEEPGADGYVLRSVSTGMRALILIAAPQPKGVLNGVFGFLEEIGFGFYLGGDHIPDRLPSLAETAARGLSVSQSPVFAVRGSLPWYNFFDSPTAWELADHKAFIDQLAKMRCNFLGFHAYDTEPFAAYEYEGQLEGGEPLVNTSQPTWGTKPLATADFLAGTGQYFARNYFGAASSFMSDRAAAIRAAKDVLRQALAYAKSRGLQTCLGFELHGDPLDPRTRARFEARLKALLADYPMLDYVWLWQPEGMGVNPPGAPRQRSLWSAYTDRWGGAFGGVPEDDRRAEAVRLVLFAQHARQVLQAARPDVRLVMSGWGGDEWLHATDFYPGMDKLLPRDVVFSALDNITATPHVSAAYGALASERTRWPIVWFEYDGDQWTPQPNLRGMEGACRDAARKGCQGLLGIHWRTRDVEDAAAFCARFAWDPGLTADAFLARRAQELAGPGNASEMLAYLRRLQELGYRWVGGAGQPECGPFVWTPGEPQKRAELATIGFELLRLGGKPSSVAASLFRYVAQVESSITSTILPLEKGPLGAILSGVKLTKEAPAYPQTPLEHLTAYTQYVLAYDQASEFLAPGHGFDDLIEQGKTGEAVQLIQQSKLADALHAYASRISNKGELGVLATINTKAWADIRGRARFDAAALDTLEQTPEPYAHMPVLLVLPDRVIVAGVPGEDVRVQLLTRPIGEKRYRKTRLEPMGGNSFALALPDGTEGRAFEYGIEAQGPQGVRLAWPAPFPAQGMTVLTWAAPGFPSHEAPTPLARPPLTIRATVMPDQWAVHLEWETQPGQTYTVSRNGLPLGEVSDGWFADFGPPANASVRYEVAARHITAGSAVSGSLEVAVPPLPLPAPPRNISVASRANRVILGWDSDSPVARQYYLLKCDASHRVIEETYIDADYGHYLQVADRVDPGQSYTYTVAGVAPDGAVGPPSNKIGIVAGAEPLEPLLRLSFRDETLLQRLADLGGKGIALGGRGWAEMPSQPEWDLTHALSLSVWVKLDDLNGIPVLVCKGAWQRAGYFLQIFNGQVRFYLAGVDTLDAGSAVAGKWQQIVATYGFGEMRVYLDGELAGRKKVSGRPRRSADPLLIGRYGAADDVYFVRGLMDDVRIYDVALTADEIRGLYDETRPSGEPPA